jgi:hypothetical protein
VRHDLTSGAWIEIVPVQDLKGKDRDRYERAIRHELPLDADGDLDKAAGIAMRLDVREIRRNAAIACLVTSWSFTQSDGTPLPLPGLDDTGAITNASSVGEYPLDDETQIEEIIAPYMVKLRRPDPKEATTSTSNGRSKAKASSLKD